MKSSLSKYQMASPAGNSLLSREALASDREEIIVQYTPFIKYVAKRLAMRLPPHISVDDLIGAGVIGLIDALSKFDPGRKVEFKTYAEFRIRGAMLDELRSLDWVPRSVRQKATQIEKTILHLEKKGGGPAEDDEIARELGIPLEDYYDWMSEVKGISLLDIESLHQTIPDLPDEDFLHHLFDKKENDPFHALSHKELKKVLASAIDELSPKEKTVLSLYYYEELTLKEIGEIMELTESRICQIHTKGILKLRGKLKRYSKETL